MVDATAETLSRANARKNTDGSNVDENSVDDSGVVDTAQGPGTEHGTAGFTRWDVVLAVSMLAGTLLSTVLTRISGIFDEPAHPVITLL